MRSSPNRIWRKTERLPKYIKAAGTGGETIWRPSLLHDREDGEALSDLLLSIFKWEPAERATTKTLLAHPWFKDHRSRGSDSQSASQQGWNYLARGKGLMCILGGLLVGVVSFRLRKRVFGQLEKGGMKSGIGALFVIVLSGVTNL